ncbi:MAG: hypothetical protein ACK5L3_04815 [Oscillospiraceae bacterium]
MKPFLALLGLSFKSLLLTSANIGRRNKKKAASGIGALLLISFLMVYISGVYSFMLAALLAPVQGLDIMLMVMLMMAVSFPLVFTLFASQGVLFSTKDMDLVLSLPLSPFSVMMARILALYLEILLMVELMLLPAGIAYTVFSGPYGLVALLLLLVLGVFLAFVPTLLCLVFGTLISLLVSRLRFKNLFTVLFSFVLFLGIMVFSFGFSGNVQAIAVNPAGIRALLAGAFPPLGWAAQAVTQPNILLLVLLALLCIVPFVAVGWVFSLFYKNILTALASHAMRRNYKLKSVRGGSSTGALFKKEARRFFGTPAYVLNHGFAIVLIVGASVFAVFQKNTIQGFFSMIPANQGGDLLRAYLAPVLLAAMAFLVGTICISSVSISLEGKTLWILKEAPLGTGRIFAAKAGFNLLLSGGTILVSLPLLGVAFALPPLEVAASLLVLLLLSSFTSLSGVFINLLFPRMDAENETIVIKQSGSVLFAFLLSAVTLALLAGLFFLTLHLGFLWFCALACLLLGALNAGTIALLNTRGRRIFSDL